MVKSTYQDRLLPANAKAIQKIVKGAGKLASVTEFRFNGARGLVLHVLPSGTATWYFHYDVAVGSTRKRRKLKLGRLDDLSLARATIEVERLRPHVQQGADPVATKTATREALTLKGLAAARFEKGDQLRPSTRRDYEHILRKDVLPFVGDQPAKSVTRDDVISVLDRMTNRGSTRRADTTRAVISSIFNFGIDRGLVQLNPASGLRNRHDNQPRDVVASETDIRKLWKAMDGGTAAMSPAIVLITKLALLTGQRRTEITAARKSQLDLKPLSPLLTTPRGMAKNRNAHRVPLSPQAAALYQSALEASGDSEYVFPGERTSTHIAPQSVSKATTGTGLSSPTITRRKR